MRLARSAGVAFLAGTDVGSMTGLYPGFGLHQELELLVRDVGLTPLEALRSATSAPATYYGRQQTQGVIVPGAVADLVLLDANPLEDIANARRIRGVVVGGRLLDRSALDALLDAVATQVRDGGDCTQGITR